MVMYKVDKWGMYILKRYFFFLGLVVFLILGLSCNQSKVLEQEDQSPHIVFVTGDEEYRSEESMPMLAQILQREMGAKISICYALDSAGYIDPNRVDHISNLQTLETADLMVLFTRFRALPAKELKYITDYAESGKPMVGFRTTTHAFMYENDSTLSQMNNEWPTKIFGQQWITHHGHFDDGHGGLTKVSPRNIKSSILRGVTPFEAYSWLYHVDGGEWKLHGSPKILVDGISLRSKHEEANRLDKFPLENPLAWTKNYNAKNSDKPARVFFTTLGHPFDFKIESMRKLSVNGIYWALEKEKEIPLNGVNVDFVSDYNPNNSGFGEKYKKGVKPQN